MLYMQDGNTLVVLSSPTKADLEVVIFCMQGLDCGSCILLVQRPSLRTQMDETQWCITAELTVGGTAEVMRRMPLALSQRRCVYVQCYP